VPQRFAQGRIREMSNRNPLWERQRIHGELLKSGTRTLRRRSMSDTSKCKTSAGWSIYRNRRAMRRDHSINRPGPPRRWNCEHIGGTIWRGTARFQSSDSSSPAPCSISHSPTDGETAPAPPRSLLHNWKQLQSPETKIHSNLPTRIWRVSLKMHESNRPVLAEKLGESRKTRLNHSHAKAQSGLDPTSTTIPSWSIDRAFALPVSLGIGGARLNRLATKRDAGNQFRGPGRLETK